METAVPVISALGTIAAIIFGVVAIVRNSKKDNKDDGAQMAAVLVDIGYIKSNTDGINSRLDRLDDKQEKQHAEVLDRLSRVEGSTASAHKRIDEIREGR